MIVDIDAVRPVLPLFGAPSEVATSAKQLQIERIDIETAVDANFEWHSQLPEVGGLQFGDRRYAFGAVFAEGLYGVAIWTRPIAANRMRRDTAHLLELRRLAIPAYSPKYTATRMLGRMARWLRQDDPALCTLLSYQITDVHSGTIYKAANWHRERVQSEHESWTTHSKRKAQDQQSSPKVRWEYSLRDCGCGVGGLEETSR